MQAEGLLFIFSGPSGAGKNTIMHAVIDNDEQLQQLPTATTRPRRDYEREGREHEFISEDEFRQRIINQELIEWQIIHDKGVYGVPRATVQTLIRSGKIAVADVDVLGAMALKEEFGDYIMLIFIEPPDMATIERRLRERDDVKTELELRTRMRRAEFEMDFRNHYDYVIVNRDGELDESVTRTREIIDRERAKTHRGTGLNTLGWSPDMLHCRATVIIPQRGHLLRHNDALPYVDVTTDQMPFAALRDFLGRHFTVDFLPTRANADKRIVDISFEAPQMMENARRPDGTILRNHIYILQPEQPIQHLPEDWTWQPIDQCELDRTAEQLLLEAVGDLQS
jgi:guanylate kinase